MHICVVVPMYNEEAIAEHSIRTIMKYTDNLPVSATLLIINDGSTDSTGSIVNRIISEVNDSQRVHMIEHARNRGYGTAHRTAIEFAASRDFDYVIFMDSDLTDHPDYLEAFYEKMTEGWDYIKTTRFANGGGYRGVPWKRRIIAKFGNSLAHVVTGLPLTDICNGFRAVKVDILKELDLQENHFSIIVEEIMKARKITDRFCEIPRIQGARDGDTKSSTFTYDFTTYWKYFKYLFT